MKTPLPKRDTVGRAIHAYQQWCRRTGRPEPDFAASHVIHSGRIRIIHHVHGYMLAEYKIGRGYKLTRIV
jgi:hypothetical protein